MEKDKGTGTVVRGKGTKKITRIETWDKIERDTGDKENNITINKITITDTDKNRDIYGIGEPDTTYTVLNLRPFTVYSFR